MKRADYTLIGITIVASLLITVPLLIGLNDEGYLPIAFAQSFDETITIINSTGTYDIPAFIDEDGTLSPYWEYVYPFVEPTPVQPTPVQPTPVQSTPVQSLLMPVNGNNISSDINFNQVLIESTPTEDKFQSTFHRNYILDDNNEYVPYKIKDTTENIIIESNGTPSIVYDKNTCGYTLYPGGYATADAQELKSISWIARVAELNTNNWNNIDELNNQSCDVIMTTEPNGLAIWSTKTLDGVRADYNKITGEVPYTTDTTIFLDGEERELFEDVSFPNTKFYTYMLLQESQGTKLELKQVLYISIDSGSIKESITISNNAPEYDNHKFAFTQTIITDESLELNDQTYQLSEVAGQNFNREWIEANQAEIFGITDTLNYDFSVNALHRAPCISRTY